MSHDHLSDFQTDREKLRRDTAPDAVFQLAQRDLIVQACLQAWRAGDLGWEEMLVYALVETVERSERLSGELIKAVAKLPPISIVSAGVDPAHQPERCDHCKRLFLFGHERIPACDKTRHLTLCRACYGKAGNSVR